MENVQKTVKNLQKTSGINDKITILSQNKDNETLKKVLEYTYNDMKMYGITDSVFEGNLGGELRQGTIFDVCDELACSNINDKFRKDVVAWVSAQDEELQDLYKGILTKDLKIGINAKTINKVFKGLIPTFDVMLAESFFKQKDTFLNGKSFSVTIKLDGMRCVYMPNERVFKSRQGQIITGLDHLVPQCEKLTTGSPYVLDGELILRNDNNLASDELFRQTMSIARKKEGDKSNLMFHVFDTLPLTEFMNGSSTRNYTERREMLDKLFENANDIDMLHNVEVVYNGEDQAMIYKLLEEAKQQNLEGVMVNINNGKYECKRTKNILKVKVMQTCDCRVIGFEEGKGKNKGTLGAIVIDYKGNPCGVGSGYTDVDRDYIWNNQEELLGKIVEVQYFEESTNKKDNSVSLRFPVYKGVRDDKNEPSYH